MKTDYLHWDEKTITNFSEESVTGEYNTGYVFTRAGKGVLHQTRSARIDLKSFELTSENRRILKKVDDIIISEVHLPHPDYHWSLGKLAHDFYEKKFGPGIMSAVKTKELLTDSSKSNFTTLLIFSNSQGPLGYAICYANSAILHYSYPFYDLEKSPKDMGLGMMTKTIVYAKEKGLTHIYLGSLQRPNDTYKLQFQGLEWFDGEKWSADLDKIRSLLKGA